MIDYLPLILTGIGIIASILYYASVLRNANTTRQAQLYMGARASTKATKNGEGET
jgi:hypothetical protein